MQIYELILKLHHNECISLVLAINYIRYDVLLWGNERYWVVM